MQYQCRLRLNNQEQVAWIDARGAKIGAMVELKADGKRWLVTEVYSFGLDDKALRDKQSMDRNALSSIRGNK